MFQGEVPYQSLDRHRALYGTADLETLARRLRFGKLPRRAGVLLEMPPALRYLTKR